MNKVIERYTTPELGAIFSDVSRMSTWLDVEVAVADALSAVGKVSKEDIETIHKTRPTIDQNFVNDVLEREAIPHHDVAAFVEPIGILYKINHKNKNPLVLPNILAETKFSKG